MKTAVTCYCGHCCFCCIVQMRKVIKMKYAPFGKLLFAYQKS